MHREKTNWRSVCSAPTFVHEKILAPQRTSSGHVFRATAKKSSQCENSLPSQVRGDAILILLELAECDLGAWLEGLLHRCAASPPLQGNKENNVLPLSLPPAKAGVTPRLRDCLTPFDILDLWRQLVNALAAVHAAGVIHFDLKPKNILVVSSEGQKKPLLKLADFGLARQLRGSRTHISADGGWGTLKYMAPEVVHQPETRFKFRDVLDVWSAGILLHQLLFDGETPHEFLLRGCQTKGPAGKAAQTKLAFGIVAGDVCRRQDKQKEVEWIVGVSPPKQGELLRDFFLATQEACLTYNYRDRVGAGVLKQQMEELDEVLAELEDASEEGGPSGGASDGNTASGSSGQTSSGKTTSSARRLLSRQSEPPRLSELLRNRPALSALLATVGVGEKADLDAEDEEEMEDTEMRTAVSCHTTKMCFVLSLVGFLVVAAATVFVLLFSSRDQQNGETAGASPTTKLLTSFFKDPTESFQMVFGSRSPPPRLADHVSHQQRWINFPTSRTLLALPWEQDFADEADKPQLQNLATLWNTEYAPMIHYAWKNKLWGSPTHYVYAKKDSHYPSNADPNAHEEVVFPLRGGISQGAGEGHWEHCVSLLTDYGMAAFLVEVLDWFEKGWARSEEAFGAGLEQKKSGGGGAFLGGGAGESKLILGPNTVAQPTVDSIYAIVFGKYLDRILDDRRSYANDRAKPIAAIVENLLRAITIAWKCTEWREETLSKAARAANVDPAPVDATHYSRFARILKRLIEFARKKALEIRDADVGIVNIMGEGLADTTGAPVIVLSVKWKNRQLVHRWGPWVDKFREELITLLELEGQEDLKRWKAWTGGAALGGGSGAPVGEGVVLVVHPAEQKNWPKWGF